MLKSNPFKRQLLEKGVEVPNGCYLCGHNEENLKHLFLKCPFIRNVLNVVRVPLNPIQVEWLDGIIQTVEALQRKQVELLLTI